MDPTPEQEAAFLAQLREKTDAGEPAVIALEPMELVILVGAVQLALRHPQYPASHRATSAAFVADALAYFADAPAVAAVIEAGNDPDQDVPWEPEAPP